MNKKDKNKVSVVDFAVMSTNIENIGDDVKEIKNALKEDYVTKTEFEPVKKIVYGVVSIILLGVVGAIIGLVIIK